MKQSAWRRATEWPLLAAAVVFLVAYSIEVIGNYSNSRSLPFDIVIWSTWGLFVVDYGVNLWLAEKRRRWFIRNLHEVAILALPALRPLRLLRLLTLLRLMREFSRAFRGRIVAYVISSAVLLTYIGALAGLDAEQDVPGSNIKNFGDALWWSIVTITTVGYGDHYPITFVGRAVAVGLMVGGIAVLGVITAALASWLVEQVSVRAGVEVEEADVTLRSELSAMAMKIEHLTAIIEQHHASTRHEAVTTEDSGPLAAPRAEG
jgi:voltage-gated potassium channel